MPGGVSSPVRAFRSVGGNPIVFDKVKGAYAWDVDGNKYVDYVGSWGPAIVGHAHDEVLAVLNEVAAKGTYDRACVRMRVSLAIYPSISGWLTDSPQPRPIHPIDPCINQSIDHT